jgi:hypothetical protein
VNHINCLIHVAMEELCPLNFLFFIFHFVKFNLGLVLCKKSFSAKFAISNYGYIPTASGLVYKHKLLF